MSGAAQPPAKPAAGGGSATGRISATPTHLIDLVPTILAAAGIDRKKAKLPGRNLAPLWRGGGLPHRSLYFEHQGNRAVRAGRWKLVALRGKPWELYDMETDRTELKDLASRRPEIAKRLASDWNRWAAENHVTPLPRTTARRTCLS